MTNYSTTSKQGNTPNGGELGKEAKRLALAGWKVFPCNPATKQPLTQHGFKDATTDLFAIDTWWKEQPQALIGFPCEPNGVFVVDLDRKDGRDGVAEFQKWGYGEPQAGVMQTTRANGLHAVYSLPERLKIPNNSDQLGQGIDLRSAGYVIIAPSPGYAWLPGKELTRESLTEAPAWLLAKIVELDRPTPAEQKVHSEPFANTNGHRKSPAEKAQHWLRHYLAIADIGSRNETGKLLAIQLRDDARLSESEAGTYMQDYAAQVPGDGYTGKEALATLHSIYSQPAREEAHSDSWAGNLGIDLDPELLKALSIEPEPAPEAAEEKQLPDLVYGFSFDHEGTAQCVKHFYPDRFLYTAGRGWLVYKGGYWQRDGMGEAGVMRAVKGTLKARRLAAVKAEVNDLVKKTSCDSWTVNGVLAMLKEKYTETDSIFDADPELLNVKNGVVHLPTGELLPHAAKYHFTYRLETEYDPTANYDEWVDWLADTVKGGQEMVNFLQEALGYTITGITREEVMFYVYGPTRSGKGTFTEALLHLLGSPLGKETPFQTFTADRSGDTQSFDLAPLHQCRLIVASESDKNRALNAAQVKVLTGGNYVYCAFKHKDMFGYRPQFKVWLVSNHKVNLDVDDRAAWARVRVVEFPNSHEGHEDKRLKDHMKSPYIQQGILRWLVEGAMRWNASTDGLGLPAAVREATQLHRDELDYVGQWLGTCTVDPGNEDIYALRDEAYRSYSTWCEENGVTPKKNRAFLEALRNKDIKTNEPKWVHGKTQRAHLGLGLPTADINTVLKDREDNQEGAL